LIEEEKISQDTTKLVQELFLQMPEGMDMVNLVNTENQDNMVNTENLANMENQDNTVNLVNTENQDNTENLANMDNMDMVNLIKL